MTTKKKKPLSDRAKRPRRTNRAETILKGRGPWQLRDAKAHLSEVVDRVHKEGPQRVTVRGKKEVVIVTADEFQKLKGEITGQRLLDVLAASPLRDVEIERLSTKSPVRDVEL